MLKETEGERVSGPVHTKLEKFENGASFKRLSLPSTLIRHENRVFSETLFKQRD